MMIIIIKWNKHAIYCIVQIMYCFCSVERNDILHVL